MNSFTTALYKILLLQIICALLCQVAIGQNNVGIGTATPHNSSILDLHSTEQGVLIPRMSAAERSAILNPAEGLLVYDMDSIRFMYFNGLAWSSLSNRSGNNDDGDWVINGNHLHSGASGNVGIGTTNPTSRIHAYYADGFDTGEHKILALVNEEPIQGVGTAGLFMGYRADGTQATGGYLRSTGQLPLFLGTHLSPQSVNIFDNGNVGIGTTTALEQLSIGGDGNIRISGATNWGIETSESPALQVIDRSNHIRRAIFDSTGTVHLGGTISNVNGAGAALSILKDGIKWA